MVALGVTQITGQLPADGYTVNNTPKAGAVMQTSQGAYGHVAYVESVNDDGSVKVSEMNYNGGPGVVSSRTISAGQAGSYNTFHNLKSLLTTIPYHTESWFS